MAAEIIETIDGINAVEEDGQLTSVSSVYMIFGLDPSTSTAASAFDLAGIPANKDLYPANSKLWVVGRSWEMGENPSGGKVTVTYKRKDVAEQDEPAETNNLGLSISSTTQTIETQKDVEGNSLYVEPPVAITADTPRQVATLSVDEAQTVFTIRGRKVANDPGVYVERYINKINSSAWNGKPSKTWKVTSITADLISIADNGSQTWEYVVTCQYNRLTWAIEVLYWDDHLNRAHKDVNLSTGAGVLKLDWYEEIDFDGIYNF